MERQEIYNKVKEHLLKQNAKSLLAPRGPEGHQNCAYRGLEGRKCAAGALIPDEDYLPEMECSIVWDSMKLNKVSQVLANNVGRNNLSFVRELQVIHDCMNPAEWSNCLAAMAQGHGLIP